MKHQSERLSLQLGPSRLLAIYISISHAVAAAALCWSALHRPLLLWLLIPLAISAGRSWVWHASRTASTAIGSLESLPDGEWRLVERSGVALSARLAPRNFVAPWMTILTFTVDRWRRRHLVLLQDNCDGDSLRRLRVRLRCATR